MGSNTPISSAVAWYRQHGPNPLATALLLGGLAFGASRYAWGPAVETLRSLGRPVGRGIYGGGEKGSAEWDSVVDELKMDSKARSWLPAIFSLLSAGGALYAFHKPNQSMGGLTDWQAPSGPSRPAAQERSVRPLLKAGAFDPIMDSYVNDIDWSMPVSLGTAGRLFSDDPYLKDDPYARQMGTAIVNNAAIRQRTSNPTLGGIFDSAVGKIESKLTFGGLAKVGVRSAVANGAARMFTGALGAMCGLSPQARQRLVDAGTWAGAVTAILD